MVTGKKKGKAVSGLSLTNEEKFKTADERIEEFRKFCMSRENCAGCEIAAEDSSSTSDVCMAHWLALLYEKPMPCPFCGRETESAIKVGGAVVECRCGYHTMFCDTTEMAISAHNRVCKAVETAKGSEANNA